MYNVHPLCIMLHARFGVWEICGLEVNVLRIVNKIASRKILSFSAFQPALEYLNHSNILTLLLYVTRDFHINSKWNAIVKGKSTITKFRRNKYNSKSSKVFPQNV